MSGINKLPGGGKNFKVNKFDAKFKDLSKRDVDIASLSENQKAIINAVNKYQYSIRSGSFTKHQQENALSQMKRGSKLSSSQVKTMKKIINHLADDGSGVKSKHKIRIIKADDEEIIMTGLASHSERPQGPGLSSISKPKDEYNSVIKRPATSIHQIIKNKGLDSTSQSEQKPPQRPPMIPLSR